MHHGRRGQEDAVLMSGRYPFLSSNSDLKNQNTLLAAKQRLSNPRHPDPDGKHIAGLRILGQFLR